MSVCMSVLTLFPRTFTLIQSSIFHSKTNLTQHILSNHRQIIRTFTHRIIMINLTMMNSFRATFAELYSSLITIIDFKQIKFQRPCIICIGWFGQSGNVITSCPPKIPGIMRHYSGNMLIVNTACAIPLEKIRHTYRWEFQVEGVHELSPSAHRHGLR